MWGKWEYVKRNIKKDLGNQFLEDIERGKTNYNKFATSIVEKQASVPLEKTVVKEVVNNANNERTLELENREANIDTECNEVKQQKKELKERTKKTY